MITGCHVNSLESNTKSVSFVPADTKTSENKLDETNIDGFEKNGDLFVKHVDNNQLIFSFLDKVTVSSNYFWKIFVDFECHNEIISKTVQLNNDGNNNFYMLVLNDRETISFYQINIYRYHMYNVVFETDGGTLIPTQKVQEQSFVAPVDEPHRVGYLFDGWDYDFKKPVLSDLVIHAKWCVRQYTITLDSGGGTVNPTNIVVAYTDSIILPTPTRKGYEFIGWYLNDELFNPENYVITNDITLIAKWEAKAYSVLLSQPSSTTSFTIVYHDNNGEQTIKTINYNEDMEYFFPTLPENYWFDGWYTKQWGIDGSGDFYDFSKGIGENIDLYVHGTSFPPNGFIPGHGTNHGTNIYYFKNNQIMDNILTKTDDYYEYKAICEFQYCNTYGHAHFTANLVAGKDTSVTLVFKNDTKNITLINNQAFTNEATIPIDYEFEFTPLDALTLELSYSYHGTEEPYSNLVKGASLSNAKMSIDYSSFRIRENAQPEMFITFDSSTYSFGIPSSLGKTFIGWYTLPNGNGYKLTDDSGNAIIPWTFDDIDIVYAYFV